MELNILAIVELCFQVGGHKIIRKIDNFSLPSIAQNSFNESPNNYSNKVSSNAHKTIVKNGLFFAISRHLNC